MIYKERVKTKQSMKKDYFPERKETLEAIIECIDRSWSKTLLHARYKKSAYMHDILGVFFSYLRNQIRSRLEPDDMVLALEVCIGINILCDRNNWIVHGSRPKFKLDAITIGNSIFSGEEINQELRDEISDLLFMGEELRFIDKGIEQLENMIVQYEASIGEAHKLGNNIVKLFSE